MTHEQQESLRCRLTAAGGAEDTRLPAGAWFVVRADDSVVTGYTSGKVLIQGRGAASIVSLIDDVLNSGRPNPGNMPFPVVGGDESGKGDVFGPLVVAAFAVRSQAERQEVVAVGARDCKLMNDGEVQAVAPKLSRLGMSSVRVLMPAEYNSRYARVRNVNILLNEIYADLLSGLAARSGARTVILDKYGGRASSLWKAQQDFRFVVETHAERYPEVAAASVLARAAFLDGLDRTARDSGIERLPKGASLETQAFMSRLVAERGSDILRSIAKVNFAPVRACLDSLF